MEKYPQHLSAGAVASAGVVYGNPVTLFEISKRRIVFIPSFVSHGDRMEFGGKIVWFVKRSPSPDCPLQEDKSLFLPEEAIANLLSALLGYLKTVREKEGEFLLPMAAAMLPYREEEGSVDPLSAGESGREKRFREGEEKEVEAVQ